MKLSIRSVGMSVLAIALGAAIPAAAQDVPKMDIGIGYQALHSGEDFISYPTSLVASRTTESGGWYRYGFVADGSYAISDQLRIVAEFGWGRHSTKEDPPTSHANYNSAAYGGGLRWNKTGSDKMTPFVQLIVGATHDTFDTGTGPAVGLFIGEKYTDNNIMVQPGGGIVLKMNEGWGVVGQVDYRAVFAGSASKVDGTKLDRGTLSQFRLVVGMRFNRK